MNPEQLIEQIEAQDFDYYMDKALANVPDTVDKREGSIIYDALGPACMALAESSMSLATVVRQTYTATAQGEFLDYRAAEKGTARQTATATQVSAKFTDSDGQPVTSVVVGDRFASLGDEPIFYQVTELTGEGSALLTAETAGSGSNGYRGQILPVTPNDSLSWAEITDVPVPARDAETDDHLRERLLSPDTYNAYGGNVADYVAILSKIDDVGAGQVYPAWQGGGTVKLVILDNDLRAASKELLATVKNSIDPDEVTGQGYGLAPIGHKVTVVAPTELSVDVTTTVEVDSQITIKAVQAQVEAGIADYFQKRRQDWDDVNTATGRGYKLTLYRAQILSEILKVEGVVNASMPKLNGKDADVDLVFTNSVSQLPVVGMVTLNG
ncbi:baseplate J/gp47 family protein [Lactiplantibacillus plajomi]|uniref:Baseplate J/gp47 family protein n=1 Tax=Lactiplantibacillus plajomi TaxID=1457217 RepID=A0ABV6K137_9LACO|nr:baseplate J/gp47 family protein [Lactiplantibacillus plajomi]